MSSVNKAGFGPALAGVLTGVAALAAPLGGLAVAQTAAPAAPTAAATMPVPPVTPAPPAPSVTQPVPTPAAPAGPAATVPAAPPAPPADAILVAPTAVGSGTQGVSRPAFPTLEGIVPTAPAAPAPASSSIDTPVARPAAPRPAAAAPRPVRPPTPREVARNIAPAFDVDRDYNRLVQCYGNASFAEALFRVQARRPGAASAAQAASQTGALKDAMQPLVLAASTVHGETKFRSDYGAVGDRLQRSFAASRNPQAVLQQSLATVNNCRTDIARWRGGR